MWVPESVPVAVVGASGYVGGELVRLVDRHPVFEAAILVGHATAGKTLAEVHPHLSGGGRILSPWDPAAVAASGARLAFLALPHGASAGPALELLDRALRVVDLGSDFRFDGPDRYREAYGVDHPRPEELGRWAYGLPELFRAEVVGSDRVAAPGCYPTAAVLSVAPLLRDGLVEPSGIVVDAKSGASGAGRAVTEALVFGAVDESVRAYKILEHRHQPEMERALEAIVTDPVRVLFTPHLVPMQRGILSTAWVRTKPGVIEDDLAESLGRAYAKAPFVEVVDRPPETRWVVGSNRALLHVRHDRRGGIAVVVAAIDNLVKGAAGQAVQCANLMFGFDEAAGLPVEGWMP